MRMLPVFLVAALVAAGGAPLSSGAGEEPGRKIAAGVQSWWIMDDGARVVFLDANGFHSWEEAGGRMAMLHPCRLAGAVWQVGEKHLCLQDEEGRLVLLDIKAGKAATALRGAESYEVYGIEKGRDWFIVQADRGDDNPGKDFYRLRLDGNSQRVYETADAHDVFAAAVSADGKGLTIWSESDDPNRMVRESVDLATGKAKTEAVGREEAAAEGEEANFALADGKGAVVVRKGRVRLAADGKEQDLLPAGGRCWARANLAEGPTHLAVCRLTDTNGDGLLAREDGDRVELWMVDLRTGRANLLADANGENIERDWSPDGQCFPWSRWKEGGGCDLLVYSPRDGKTTAFPSPGKNRLWLPEAFLADGRILVAQRELPEGPPQTGPAQAGPAAAGDAPKPLPGEILLLDLAAPGAAPLRLARGTNPGARTTPRAIYIELMEGSAPPEEGAEGRPWSRATSALYRVPVPPRRASPATAPAR